MSVMYSSVIITCMMHVIIWPAEHAGAPHLECGFQASSCRLAQAHHYAFLLTIVCAADSMDSKALNARGWEANPEANDLPRMEVLVQAADSVSARTAAALLAAGPSGYAFRTVNH